MAISPISFIRRMIFRIQFEAINFLQRSKTANDNRFNPDDYNDIDGLSKEMQRALWKAKSELSKYLKK